MKLGCFERCSSLVGSGQREVQKERVARRRVKVSAIACGRENDETLN